MRKEEKTQMNTFRMFTETVTASRACHHHFIQVQGNEDGLDKLEELIAAYDSFRLDTETHGRKFTLSKSLLNEMNVVLASSYGGMTWKVLRGRLTTLPDVKERKTALAVCQRLANRGIETMITSVEREMYISNLINVIENN